MDTRSRRRNITYATTIVAAGIFVAAITGTVLSKPMSSVKTENRVEVAGPAGALVSVNFQGQVGVLLDEFPDSVKDRVAADISARGEDFWISKAKDQIHLMSYRLVFRDSYYDESEGKGALPLPPDEIWNIQIENPPHRITTGDGNHDAVVIDYGLATTILTNIESPGKSEPNLGTVGGKWSEHFVLPLDPAFLFQRTGFACMDENQFPPRSVDAEETDTFYDQETDVEDELSIEGFHQTEMPETSCVDALDKSVGKIEGDLNFERIPWDSAIADTVRVGKISNLEGPDLKIEDSVFKTNRLVYRYIGQDDCALVENTVGGSGWRRLLQFSAADRNIGAKNLEIGDIDYYIEGRETELSKHGIYEFSPCHNHYHFVHYGTFSFGDSQTHKLGFCLQSTDRLSNNEYSPLVNVYSGCDFQGIESGWVDEYKIGLEGQWVDVTDINTTASSVTKVLRFHSNPLGFLCEGAPITDDEGIPVYEMTQLKTSDGHSVFKPRCDYAPGALENNVESYPVTLPRDGFGYVTEDCRSGEIGPLRNCGFEKSDVIFNCTPGGQVRLKATLPETAPIQVVRVCEFSEVLNTSIPCTFNGPQNAKAIANQIVDSSSEIEFGCPSALDENEPGGKFSIYYGPLMPDDMFVTPSLELDL